MSAAPTQQDVTCIDPRMIFPDPRTIYPSSTSHSPSAARPARVFRPRDAYSIFCSEMNEKRKRSSKGQHPGMRRPNGELWNKLSTDEKAPYYRAAEVKMLEHQLQYPEYHFTPPNAAPKPRRRRPSRAEEVSLARQVPQDLTHDGTRNGSNPSMPLPPPSASSGPFESGGPFQRARLGPQSHSSSSSSSYSTVAPGPHGYAVVHSYHPSSGAYPEQQYAQGTGEEYLSEAEYQDMMGFINY